jgi:SAM-dependent methyltransferase
VAHPPDSKQFEKDYLKRTGIADWDRTKPFAPPGRDTVDESLALIHDFAVALRCLAPTPADLILDLGAGACWCSDWLERLNLRAVSIDISHDMLALGRERLRDGRRLAVGDMEHLPFRAGAFDKAICLNALHHVPDIPRAVGEIARVLKDDGVALFSEPGKGHDEKPGSVAAMRDFGVLEQEILVGDFLEACRRSGFADVRIQPMAYAIAEFDLTPDEWAAWDRQARRRRPWRAAEKIWRGVLELAGAGKRGALFEETIAMSLVRLLKGAMDDHPIVVASKSGARRARGVHRAQFDTASVTPPAPQPGGHIVIEATVRNTGSETWRSASASGFGHVQVGIQLLDDAGRLVNRDFCRAALPGDVPPRGMCAVRAAAAAPNDPGPYQLKLDLVVEGVTWFEPQGSAARTIPLEVRSDSP